MNIIKILKLAILLSLFFNNQIFSESTECFIDYSLKEYEMIEGYNILTMYDKSKKNKITFHTKIIYYDYFKNKISLATASGNLFLTYP
jgi:hypothetical protein